MEATRRGLLLIFCVCISLTPAWCQEAKTLSAIPPNGFQFQGAWDCTGAMGNGTKHRSTYTGSLILGGKWLELTEQDIEPATGYLAKYLIGYDAEQKRLVEFDANNFGAAVYSSADGWQNGVLTMTSSDSSDAKASYQANRFVFSVAGPDVAGPDAFNVDWQIRRASPSTWVTSDHLACRRASHA
jgi:hypothetical protein